MKQLDLSKKFVLLVLPSAVWSIAISESRENKTELSGETDTGNC